MKKRLLLMLAVAMSLSTFAQKDELKAAEKALKSGDLTAAKSAIDQAESVIANDEKLLSKFYFLKAQTYYDIAKKNPSLAADAYDVSAKSFQELLDYEKETGKSKYTTEAQPLLNSLISDVSQKGIKEYQDKDYTSAKASLYKTYTLSPKDTTFLEYAAMAAYLDKDFDKALEHFYSLKELGYTGIATTYSATNVESGEVENFGNKNQMDLMVKSGQYKDPKVETSESKRPTMIKNIALILVEKGETEGAMEAVREAREADPSDIGMLFTEANILLKLGKKDEFANAMKAAIERDPTNPMLYFNVGVINQEQGNIDAAKEYYQKAIDLDPNYADAYLNMGAAMLDGDKALVDEMNQNLSNFKKYDEIKARQKELYKEVIPFYEKAFDIKKKENDGTPDVDIAKTLMSLYENVGMDDKFKEMKAIWDASK